jgi:hypothetical protein
MNTSTTNGKASGIFGALRGGAGSTERFFGTVKAFNTSAEIPHIVVTTADGQDRKVALNPDSKNLNIKEGYERPALSKFQAGKSKTEIGGVLRIEDAFLDRKTGMHMARWVSSALPRADSGYVTTATARVNTLRSRDNGPDYRSVDVLDEAAIARPESASALVAAVHKAVETHGAAFIRLTDGEQVNTRLLSGGRSDLPIAERLAKVDADDKFQALIEAVQRDGIAGVVLEVVPAERLFFGAETAGNKKLDKLFTATNTVEREGGDVTYVNAKGFAEVMLTVHVREDGSKMVVGALPKAWNTPFTKAGPIAMADGATFATGAPDTAGPDSDHDAHHEIGDIDLADLASQAPAQQPAGMGMR